MEKQDFNMAVSDLNRLNYWFAIAEEAQQVYNSLEWYSALRVIKTLLSCYADEDNYKDLTLRLQNLKANIQKNSMISNKKHHYILNDKDYDELDEIHSSLRRIAKDSGLLNRDRVDVLAPENF